MTSIEAQYGQWSACDSTELITASEGRVAAVNVAVDKGTLSVRVQEDNIKVVRDLMKARGLNIIEQSV